MDDSLMRWDRILIVVSIALLILGSAVLVLGFLPVSGSRGSVHQNTPQPLATLDYNLTTNTVARAVYHIRATLNTDYDVTVTVVSTGAQNNYSLYAYVYQAPFFFISYPRLVQYFSNFSTHFFNNESGNRFVHVSMAFNQTVYGQPTTYLFDLRYNVTDGVLLFLNGTRSFPQFEQVNTWRLTSYQVSPTGVQALRNSAGSSVGFGWEYPLGVLVVSAGVVLLVMNLLWRRKNRGPPSEMQEAPGRQEDT